MGNRASSVRVLLIAAQFMGFALCAVTPLQNAFSAEQRKADDLKVLSDALVGEYVVVGRLPETEETYQGHVVLKKSGTGFSVTRTIGGITVEGTASFETAGADKIPVLRMRFVDRGKEWEGTYRWSSDLDNYFRLTGYVYAQKEVTEAPGLEALFPTEPLKASED